jgi:SAM-dependent methyltransferase
MAEKIRNPEYPASLTDGGWFIPTDYVITRSSFKKDLREHYFDSLPAGSRVLDLNAGTDGPGPYLLGEGHEYLALEQNRLVRDFLSESGVANREWRPPVTDLDAEAFDLVLSLAFLEHLPTWIDAFQQLLEIKRVLKPGGRLLVIAPNAPGMGGTYHDDYKQCWHVSRKRLEDMAADAGFEVASSRYTLGWIRIGGGPVWSIIRFVARTVNGVMNWPWVRRFMDAVGLEDFSARVRKTIFELVAVEMRKP